MCPSCRQRFRPAPDRWIEPGLLVRSAWVHDGPARLLVHRLKYEGIPAAAAVLAAGMAPVVGEVAALVPVPRTRVRTQIHGIDPASELARSLGRILDVPVHRALRPPFGGRKRAGRGRSDRAVPRFVVAELPPPGSVLVDDVVTTGGTLSHVGALVGVRAAVTATSRILGSSREPVLPKHQGD